MEINILDSEGKVTGQAQLPEHMGGLAKKAKSANVYLVHEVVKAYLGNRRRGTQSALTRSEVQGGGKKPWKQKHTGRARAGTSSSPLWKGGGIVFAPKPRSYYTGIPQAKVKSALSQVFVERAMLGDIVVSEPPKMEVVKTKSLAAWLKKMSFPKKTLLIVESSEKKLVLAARNLESFEVIPWKHIHPFHLLNARKVVLTSEVLKIL